MSSCQTVSIVEPGESTKVLTLPASIDYHAEGGLAHLVYRSKFEYNAANQLVSVRDSLMRESTSPAMPWVQFSYTNNRLSAINLRALSNDLDSIAYSRDKPARFELTYEGQTLNARLLIDNQEIKRVSLALDQEGYPVKTNVRLGGLFLDGQGHLDREAESKNSLARNPKNFYEVLDQQYDQNRTVFADSKEYQLLAALLASFNRSVVTTTFLGGLDVLTRNNLLTRTTKYCAELEGCRLNTLKRGETPRINADGFPLQRIAIVGVMGYFTYTITYK